MVKETQKSLEIMKMYRQHNFNGINNKVLLLEAELSTINRNMDEAMTQYDESIKYAEKEGFWNEAGLACERAARSLQRCGRIEEARTYLLQAKDAYTRWGAFSKVQAVSRKQLFNPH
jgi:hypothetical protein